MNCVRCSKEIPDGSLFCNYCGTKQDKKKPTRRGNGMGSVYRLRNGWAAVVTLGYTIDGKRKTKTKTGFTTKTAALRYLSVLSEAHPEASFTDAYTAWSEKKYPTISEMRSGAYALAWERLYRVHSKKIREVTTKDLQQVVDESGLGQGAKRDMKILLCALYDWATQNDYAEKNYAQYVIVPAQPKGRKLTLTDAEIQSIWDYYKSGNEYARYYLILIYTGLRVGELASLDPNNIHDTYLVGGSKTQAGKNRIVPIAPKIKDLFVNFQPKSKQVLQKMFARLKTECSLNPDLVVHDLRHTAATLFVRSQIPPEQVKEILGHANYATTINLYTHIPSQDLVHALDNL